MCRAQHSRLASICGGSARELSRSASQRGDVPEVFHRILTPSSHTRRLLSVALTAPMHRFVGYSTCRPSQQSGRMSIENGDWVERAGRRTSSFNEKSKPRAEAKCANKRHRNPNGLGFLHLNVQEYLDHHATAACHQRDEAFHIQITSQPSINAADIDRRETHSDSASMPTTYRHHNPLASGCSPLRGGTAPCGFAWRVWACLPGDQS